MSRTKEEVGPEGRRQGRLEQAALGGHSHLPARRLGAPGMQVLPLARQTTLGSAPGVISM